MDSIHFTKDNLGLTIVEFHPPRKGNVNIYLDTFKVDMDDLIDLRKHRKVEENNEIMDCS
jgi:hypothetical protein